MTRLLIRAVVFDLDDTLMPETDYVRSGYAHVSKFLAPRLSCAPETLEAQLWEIFNSEHRAHAYNRLLHLHGVTDPKLVQLCVDSYRSHNPSVSLRDEAEEVLDWCLANGPVGVVTDGPKLMQAAKVAALGLTERGLHVVLTDALGGQPTWKPSPAGMLEVCRRLGLETDECVYVGDNPSKDFLAARSAGMSSIRYRTSGQIHEGLEPGPGAEADLEIRDLRDLRSVVRFN